MGVELIWNRIKTLNANHILFVILCGIIAYLFRASDSYKLKPVWRKRVDSLNYVNERFPTAADRLPPPIITDLEGDGIHEILLMSSDLKLSALALPNASKSDNEDEDDQTLPHVIVRNKVILSLTDDEDGRNSRPVAMETGFTVPYHSMMQIRKQIIVIATDDWHVLCYSHDLQLLWKQKLMDIGHVRDTYEVKDMGILITSHKVKKDDEGLVIIGGSFTHKKHEIEKSKIAEQNNTDSNTENDDEHTTEDNTMTHFSSFAVNGKDGSIRWHHLPGDFGVPIADIKDIHGDHHWKLGLKKSRLHTGEAPWGLYKEEIFSFLPHVWRNIDDTRLTLGRFEKRDDSSEEIEKPEESRHRMALTPQHVMGYAYGGQRPHSDHEHVANPNTVVIHNHNGLEILNLLTGRPVTEFTVPKDQSVYVDIDRDGNMEQLVWGQGVAQRPCHIEIWRLQPVKEKVDQLAVCRMTRVFFTTSWAYDEDSLQKVPPLIIKSVARKSGFFRYLLGHHLPTDKQQYDIITTGGMARLSSYDKEGNANWQSQTQFRWAEAAMDARKREHSDPGRYEEFTKSFYPNILLMSAQVSAKKTVAAFGAYRGISLVNLETGNILAEHSLPCMPTAPLVAGDFDNDGMNDIIVTCKLGYFGFTLHRHANHVYTVLYAFAVFFAILLLSWFCTPDTYNVDEEYDEDNFETFPVD